MPQERCERLSRGTRQKVALAGPLVHEPQLIILDEPFTGLDAGSARLVQSVLRERAHAGCSVIMTTHILDVAERMADRIGVMVAGRLRPRTARQKRRLFLLAFDRFAEERLGGRDIALGAQPEVDRPARPVNGTIQVAPLASDLDVCLVDPPRLADLEPGRVSNNLKAGCTAANAISLTRTPAAPGYRHPGSPRR
jgi:energy-coupling factor transporter ATP-binding protein EcfA2